MQGRYSAQLSDVQRSQAQQEQDFSTQLGQVKDQINQVTIDDSQTGGAVAVVGDESRSEPKQLEGDGRDQQAGASGSTGASGRDDVRGSSGATGAVGARGQNGTDGATGPAGPQGPSGIASCPNGNCLSLQGTNPGTQEVGNINISGDGQFGGAVSAGSFSGDGTGVSNVDATALNGQNGTYYQDASNLNVGTLNDSRLSSNVTLQGNSFNSAGQLVQLNGSGALPSLDGSQLSNVDASSLGGQNGAYYQNADNINGGTLADSRLSGNVTLQGNSFNGANQLVKLSGGGILPILDGSQLTNVLAANSVQLGGQAASYYLNASNLNSGTLSDVLLSSNVTLQGNTFNGANQLVKLAAGGGLPVLDGSQLTDVDAETLNGQLAAYYLNASNINGGTLADARLSTNVALKNATNTFTGTNNFAGLTATGILQNGYSVCSADNNCNYAAASGSASYIQNGTGLQIANFNVSGNGYIGGSVGIGTDSPGSVLTLRGQANDAGGLRIRATNGDRLAIYALGGNSAAIKKLDPGSSLHFKNSSDVTELQIASSGNVSIGTQTQLGQLGVLNDTASDIGLAVRGAAGQIADLLQLQNSSGASLTSIDAAGVIRTSVGVDTTASNGAYLRTYVLQGPGGSGTINVGGSLSLANGFVSATMNSNSKNAISANQVFAGSDWSYTADFKRGGVSVVDIGRLTDSLRVMTRAADSNGIIVRGVAGQTADLLQVQNSSGTVLSKIDASGNLTVKRADIQGEYISFSNNIRGYNNSVTAAASTQSVTFGTAYPDANYAVFCTPNWNTTCFVSGKSTTGFTLNFGTAAPAGQLVDWFVAK